MHRGAMETDDGDRSDDDEEGAESSYSITFTAEDAAVRGVRDVVLPSNLFSAIAGNSPSSDSGYGLFSSFNPNLNDDHTRDVVIPGANTVDASQENFVIADPLDQTPTDKMEEEDDTVAFLQMVGVIPFLLDVFKARCGLRIKYRSGNELKNGDILPLGGVLDEHPSVAITQPSVKEAHTLLRGNLFTVIMVALDGVQYLNWVLVNVSDQFGVHKQGTAMVDYEPPSRRISQGRRPYLFVAYSQKQPFHLESTTVGRQRFDLRDFAATYELDHPVAAVYVTIAAE